MCLGWVKWSVSFGGFDFPRFVAVILVGRHTRRAWLGLIELDPL